LKWSTHISKITKKASSTISFLRRNLSLFYSMSTECLHISGEVSFTKFTRCHRDSCPWWADRT